VLAALADTHDALMIILGTARGGLMSAIDRVIGASVSARLIRHTPPSRRPGPRHRRTDETEDARTSSRRGHGELHRLTEPTTPGAGVGIGAAEPAESTVVARALPETLRGNGFGYWAWCRPSAIRAPPSWACCRSAPQQCCDPAETQLETLQ